MGSVRHLTSQDHGVAKCGAGVPISATHSAVGMKGPLWVAEMAHLRQAHLSLIAVQLRQGKAGSTRCAPCTSPRGKAHMQLARLCENVLAMQVCHGQQVHALGQLCELSDHSMCSKHSKHHVHQAPSPAIWRGDANSRGSLSLEQRKVSTLNASLWPRSLLLRQTASGLEYP